MKALLVGDNRELLNWGGRGQSLALYRLLNEIADDVKVISGKSVGFDYDNDIFIKTVTPYKTFKFIAKNRKENVLFDLWYKIERLLGARDVVSENPEKSATMLIRYKSKLHGLSTIYRKIEEADVVVINGEGSGVFSTPYRRDFFFYLMIAEISSRLKKRTYFVNAIISDCPTTGRNPHSLEMARRTLRKCDAVALRDMESLEYVRKEMPDVNSCYIPDALFTWFNIYEHNDILPKNGNFMIPFPDRQEYYDKLDFSKPYICVGGSSLAAYRPDEAFKCYSMLIKGLRKIGLPIYLTECCAGDRFLQDVARELNVGFVPVDAPIYMCGAVLANAKLFISGRFHAAILASLGGTPCIFLKAHSHKMISLQRILEYQYIKEYSELPKGNEIDEIVDLCTRYLEDETSMRYRIKEVCKRLSGEAENIKNLFSV